MGAAVPKVPRYTWALEPKQAEAGGGEPMGAQSLKRKDHPGPRSSQTAALLGMLDSLCTVQGAPKYSLGNAAGVRGNTVACTLK